LAFSFDPPKINEFEWEEEEIYAIWWLSCSLETCNGRAAQGRRRRGYLYPPPKTSRLLKTGGGLSALSGGRIIRFWEFCPLEKSGPNIRQIIRPLYREPRLAGANRWRKIPGGRIIRPMPGAGLSGFPDRIFCNYN
jgi:hypothetical protein